VFLSHRLEGLETTYDVHLGLIGKRVLDFLLNLIELFRYVLRLRRYDMICVDLTCAEKLPLKFGFPIPWH